MTIILILIAIFLIIHIISKIYRYRRIDHTHTTYDGSPLKNKYRRGTHYQNNRPDMNPHHRRPMNSTFQRPRQAMADRPNEPMFNNEMGHRPNQPMNNMANGPMGQVNNNQKGFDPGKQNPSNHGGNF